MQVQQPGLLVPRSEQSLGSESHLSQDASLAPVVSERKGLHSCLAWTLCYSELLLCQS